KLERARKKYEYERGGGKGSTGIGATITDIFSDSGEDLDRDHEELLKLEQDLKDKGVVRLGVDGKLEMVPGAKLDPEQQRRLGEGCEGTRLDVTNYQEAKDTVTNGLAEVATVVVGGAVTVLTAGAASPALVAALAALAGGEAGILTKLAMQ